MELMQANRQWSSRPADERFISLTDLDAFCQNQRGRSIGKVLSNRALHCVPVEGDNGHYNGLSIVGPNGAPVRPTHWSFGQLAQRAGAPAAYLRDLPEPLAADCINYGLKHARDVEEIGVLLTRQNDANELRAVTGPNYGRIWNGAITRALVNRFGDGLTGDFRVPGEFGKAVAIDKGNTTLYASDRDMFVFLADEQHRIEVPNRRNGKSGDMARGFFLWNSEVGAASVGIATFLFDYVCCNRIVWGAAQYNEIRLRHTSGAPDRWIEEISPALESYATSSAASITAQIAAAKAARIDDVDKFLRDRFNGKQVAAIKAAHLSDEDRPIETLWDATTAVTGYARQIAYQNDRVELEREGGKILALAA